MHLKTIQKLLKNLSETLKVALRRFGTIFSVKTSESNIFKMKTNNLQSKYESKNESSNHLLKNGKMLMSKCSLRLISCQKSHLSFKKNSQVGSEEE